MPSRLPRPMPWLLAPLLALAAIGCGGAEEPASSDEQDLFGAKALLPEPAGDPARHPIVLAHGMDASPTNRWGFYRVREALEADGHAVHVAVVPPYDGPDVRAEHLADAVDQALSEHGAERVNVVAHSMGGLDARYLVSSLGYGDRVASVTTISSPHGGSFVADVALELLPGSFDDALDALASAWGLTFNELSSDSHVRAALEALAESNIGAFNQANPDDPGVHYQSWAGVSSVAGIPGPKDGDACEGLLLRHKLRADRLHASLVPMAAIVAHGTDLRPNDGMATVESAKWGEFRGCVPADHLDEVGQPRHEGMDKHTGFDHLRFYRGIAFDLAARGF